MSEEEISMIAYNLYLKGLSYSEIGEELNISDKTAKNYVDKCREIEEKEELNKNDGYKDLTKNNNQKN